MTSRTAQRCAGNLARLAASTKDKARMKPSTPGRTRDRAGTMQGLRHLGIFALGACAAYQVALGVYFIALRPAFLPEDERATRADLAEIMQVAPGFEAWIHRVLIVLGGQAAASGVLLALALVLLRNGASSRAAVALLVGAGGCSVALMSAVNFSLHSDFRWVLIVPGLTWGFGAFALWLGGATAATEPARAQ